MTPEPSKRGKRKSKPTTAVRTRRDKAKKFAIRGGGVRLGIEAPPEALILREELLRRP
jgi:sRNA-binding carbon storage regulator CsrA